MATLIDPHLFCFSYHRHTQNSQQDPTWQQWQQNHPLTPVDAAEYALHKGNDWDALYYEENFGDSTGLLLYAAIRNGKQPQPLSRLKDLKAHLAGLHGSIGQTWLVMTQWQPETPAQSETEILQAILNLWDIEKIHKPGQFLGTPFYPTTLKSGETLLVFLCPNPELRKELDKFYYEWLWLFVYEHKMHWMYAQSSKIKQILSQETFFPLTDEIIPASQINLNESQIIKGDFQEVRRVLYNNMQKLDRHTRGIEGLSLQLQTLITNIKAYQTRLQDIQSLIAKHPQPSDLTPWLDVATKRGALYQEQIQQDINSLSPGLRVREQHIKTLQVIVEAAQGERDRHLENTIAAAGLGVGVSSAAAGAWAGQTPRPIHTFGISLGLGVLSSVVVYGLLYLFRPNR